MDFNTSRYLRKVWYFSKMFAVAQDMQILDKGFRINSCTNPFLKRKELSAQLIFIVKKHQCVVQACKTKIENLCFVLIVINTGNIQIIIFNKQGN